VLELYSMKSATSVQSGFRRRYEKNLETVKSMGIISGHTLHL